MRQGASRPSRSTRRSTVIFAIRRHVVSLPPVIVTMPLEVSYSSALREMSTDFFGSPVEISGRTPGVGARDVLGDDVGREERVDRLEQVGDVLVGRAHVLDVALVVVVGRADQRLAEPRQHEDPAPARRRDDRADVHRQALAREDDVRAAAGPDHRHLGLVVQLVGADAVRPHAGGVDDGLGPDRERLARVGVADLGAARATALLEQPGDLEPVGEHRAEALGLAEHGQHEPHVVGLAVVEEVAAAGLAVGQRGQQLDDLVAADHAVARRAPVLLAVLVAVADAPAAERRAPQAVDRHHVVHVEPEAEQAVGPRAVEGGHDHRQRPHQVRARARR